MQILHMNGPAPYYTNSFVLIGDKGSAVVIDPAAPAAEYDRILRENNAKTLEIYCTHGHFDHVEGASALQKKWGCPLRCEPEDVGDNRMYPLKSADGGFAEAVPWTVDDMEFTAWHTPGHTRGSVVLLCREAGSDEPGWFITGDTLFAGSMGRTDLPGGNEATMMQSLKKLNGLPVSNDAPVLPGHGEFSTFGEEKAENYYLRMNRG